jgi:hypothetical protein
VLDNGDAQAQGLGGHVREDSAGWAGGLTSHERMFVAFAILSCVSSHAQHSGRSAVADLGRGLAAIAAEDIDRRIDEQTTSPRQERKR